MAGLKELGDALHMSDESDNEDEVVVYDGRMRGEQFSIEETENRERSSTHQTSWKRYRPSLKTLVPIRSSLKNDEVARIDQAGCLSFITYAWVFGYLWSAFRGLIPRDQTWSCSLYDSAGTNMTRLEYLWKTELKRGRPGGPSLVRVVLRFFRTRLILACVVFLFCLAFGFIGPTCLVRALIAYAEAGDTSHPAYGLGLVVALVIVELCRVLSYGACWAISYRTGIRVRGAALALLYRKLIHLRGLHSRTTAEIVNIFGNDGQRLFDAVTFAPLVLMGPTVLIGGLIFLLVILGPWALLGVLVFFVFDCFQYALGKTMVKYRNLAIAKTEARVSAMGEILRCIKIIKMNAWERPFMDKIKDLRREEKRSIRSAAYAQSLAIAAGPVVPVVAAIVTFLAYIDSGHDLLASDAFSAITIFFVMVFGIRMIPYGMRYLAESLVALRKIQKLLLLNEADLLRPPPLNKDLAIVIQDANFGWDHGNELVAPRETAELQPLSLEEKTALRALNLVVEKKQLIGVCGPVGCGKSALLKAIVGQLIQQDGNISVCGTLAYSAQQPWILHTSVRENIVFGDVFEENRYYRILYACSLNQDVNNMPAHDLTEIGERGVTLSGGQKARISLARALYSNRDILLLDDVLSALDVPVAQHVFNYAIKGVLVGKTVLLVTSNVEYLSMCDEVLLLNGGRIMDMGPHQDLLMRCKEYVSFTEVALSALKHRSASIENMLGDTETGIQSPLVQRTDSEVSLFHRKQELMRERGDTTLSGTESLFDIPSAVQGQMVEQEEDFGLKSMSWYVYGRYIKAAGGCCMMAVCLLAFAANVGSSVFSTAWLSFWLKEGHSIENGTLADDPRLGYFSVVYGVSLLILFITSFFKAIIWVKVALNAASNLHGQMFTKLMHGCIRFFDSNPSGRILNRFSKDMDEIDVKLPFTAETFLQNMITVVAYLIVISCVMPWFLVACVPLGIVFALFVACFRAGIRSLKRSENLSRSPLFDHITASLDGLDTIHAYGQTRRFLDKLKILLDSNSAAMFMFQSAMRWLAVWLDLLVVAVSCVAALLIVLMTGTISPSYAGMALAFAIQMSGIFQFAVRMQTDLEAKMTSVERIDFYIEHIEEEDLWFGREYTPPLDWPANGRISFRDVKLRYRENIPPALKGVSFDIKAMEKIGIVGRTGSGKSSLGVALFRLYPISGGSVSVDGVDIGKVGLHELRGKMEAIPQDPVLFAGTLRFNLDPFRQHTDDRLWKSLEKTHLKTLVMGNDKGLDAEVTEGGGNFSVGQRQLLCMARALLRNVRILLLDEATSSLDPETDSFINECLQDHFLHCTTLIIAHRLTSIMHADKILFMDNGKILEFDQPTVLMGDAKSRFYQMVARTPETHQSPDTQQSAQI